MFKVLGMSNQSIIPNEGRATILIPASVYAKIENYRGKREFIYEETDAEIVIRISKRNYREV